MAHRRYRVRAVTLIVMLVCFFVWCIFFFVPVRDCLEFLKLRFQSPELEGTFLEQLGAEACTLLLKRSQRSYQVKGNEQMKT